MVSTRLLGLVSTVLLVVGALLVGQGFHLSLVAGEIAVTSASFALHLVVGTVLIALGYRARGPVAEAYDLTSDESGGGDEHDTASSTRAADGLSRAGEDAEFDPSVSPLGEGGPGDAERERADREDRPDRERAEGDERGPARDDAGGERSPRDGTPADES